jgi:streptomycin 3"-adenylyltransferase
LGDDLVGTYLHGSAVLGGGGPYSDVDVLAVAKRRTTREEKQRLVELLLNLSGNPSPIEFDLVVATEVRPWRHPAPFDFHYSELWRKEFAAGNLEPWSSATNRDLASAVTMVLAGNTTLYGPPPAQVFDPVPRTDYHDAILKDVPPSDWFVEKDTRNLVLTLVRVWAGVASEGVHSKESAAAWALTRLPTEHQPLLERAVAIYLGERDDFWDDVRPQIEAYANYVVSEIESAMMRLQTEPS